MLFKTQHDATTFSIDDLFKEERISKSLHKIDIPESLKLKPKELYERLKDIAQKRYGFKLPEKQVDLACLQSPSSKISLLRDISIKVGIKIALGQKEFIFDNDSSKLTEKISESYKEESKN